MISALLDQHTRATFLCARLPVSSARLAFPGLSAFERVVFLLTLTVVVFP